MLLTNVTPINLTLKSDSQVNLNEFPLAKDATTWAIRIITTTEYNTPNMFKPVSS